MVSLRDEYGYDVPTAAKATCRVPCSACGTSKRHLVRQSGGRRRVRRRGDRTQPRRRGRRAVRQRAAVGDRVSRPPAARAPGDGFPKKVKPLIRLTERETAAWCVVRGIDYLVEECPMAVGNKHLAYKDSLNATEANSPGSKAAFYLGFLDRMAPILAAHVESNDERPDMGACSRCGAPTPGEICAFCRIVEKASGHEPVPVELVSKPGRPGGRRRR
ncbi:MAG: hypothetical protein R2705_03620 [Ilumatobacteraceae bacterium]